MFFAYFAGFIGMYALSFYKTFLALKLNKYGVANEDMGYYFLIQSAPYLPACILAPIVFKNVPPKL